MLKNIVCLHPRPKDVKKGFGENLETNCKNIREFSCKQNKTTLDVVFLFA